MAHTGSARPPESSASDVRTGVRALLFKPDHPRAIDQHIDYFGGAQFGDAAEPDSDTDDDACGDIILERPA